MKSTQFRYSLVFHGKTWLLLPLFVALVPFATAQVGNGCTTPFNEAGTCIPIRQCPPLWRIITEAPRPLPERAINYIRQSQCGNPSDRAVCCRLRDVNPQQTSQVTPRPASVTRPPTLSMQAPSLPVDCGPLSSNRISRGNKTELFQYPWNARLMYRDGVETKFLCGGSVISRRMILTAAHCCARTRGTVLVGVRLGEHDTRTNPDCSSDGRICAAEVQDIDVDTCIVHPQYNSPKYANDIALIRLQRLADLSDDSVKAVCLPLDLSTRSSIPNSMIVTGWGTTEMGTESTQLLQARVPLVDRTTCQEKFRRSTVLTDGQICAGGQDGVDSCNGDSGGPLQYPVRMNGTRYVQFGVVSFGVKTCGQLDGYPGVYADVSFYMDWILSNISN